MAGITLAQAEAQLAVWLAASTAAAANQSYTVGDRSLTRANAAEIRTQIDYWQGYVNRLQPGRSGGMRVRGVTPV